MKKSKIIWTSFCLTLALIVSVFFTLQGRVNTAQDAKLTRTVETRIDYNSLLETFDSYEMQKDETSISLEADKRISLDLSELDNLSLGNKDETTNVHYSYEYDLENNIVYMTLTFIKYNETIEIDTLVGFPFYENGVVDVVFSIDGEIILMSEMTNLSVINQCGLFSKIFKAVVAVVVSAIVATVVATAGAGLAVVVTAGAVAGAVTGAVAGGCISISEYGKLDWKWVVGGLVIGAALGAVVGYGVGVALGAPTASSETQKLINATKNGTIKRSDTVNGYYISGERPYVNSNLLAEEIMKAKAPFPDPQSATGLKWVVEGCNGASKGVWELVVDPVSKTIWHFIWKTIV
jgi:hypothetical protein